MQQRPQIKVLVAAHKPYWMPQDSLYLPVQVGSALHEHIDGYAHDDQGDNISDRNPRYCELTALWWGWRNLGCDWLGLVHYRRHFSGTGERKTMTEAEARVLVEDGSVVVAKHRNYVIESIATHYMHTFDPDGSQLAALRAAVAEVSPERLDVHDRFLAGTRGYMFNMTIMPRTLLDPYCTWLFDVLEAAERRIDFTKLSAFDERCIGRLGERLFNTWLLSEGVPVREVRVENLEGTNWVKKGSAFLAAKFLGKSYKQSF